MVPALYPFTIMNYSHEQSLFLSSMSPQEITGLTGGLEDTQQGYRETELSQAAGMPAILGSNVKSQENSSHTYKISQQPLIYF
jgi:hypothetical protein